MIVCSCNALSDKTVRDCLAPGPDCPFTPAQLYRCLGCSPQCGRCARTIRNIMDEALPSVHSACTTQCSARCPLTAAAEDDAVSVAVVDAVEAVETPGALDVCETVEVYEFAGA